jgi:integrase/recombinase XerD
MDDIRLHQFAEKLALRGYSARCSEDYPKVVGLFLRYLEEREGVSSLGQLKAEHVRAYQSYVQFGYRRAGGKALSVGGVCTRLGALRTFLRLMHSEGVAPEDLSLQLTLPKRRQSLPRAIPSQAQAAALLKAAGGDTPLTIRDRAILEVLYATGIRSAELCGLRVEDWDQEANTLLIHGKGSKERMVPLGEWVTPHLLRYLGQARPRLTESAGGLMFVSKRGKRIARRNLLQMLWRSCAKAGLPRIRVHAMRHACATHLLENGADIRYIQELLGHAKLSATQVYTKVDIGALKRMHRQYHPRERQDA